MKNLTRFVFAAAICAVFAQFAFAQNLDRIERGRLKDMLASVKSSIKKNYYDANFRGIDLDARFAKAEARMDEVSSLGQGFAVIAQVLMEFNDSHLYFMPPETTTSVDYGLRMKAVGDKVFVTSVRPKSDAEAKGLKAGDEILKLEGFRPNRKELWKMVYYYYTLSPRTKLNLTVAHASGGDPADIEIAAKIRTKSRILNLTNTFDLNDVIRDSDNRAERNINYFAKNSNFVIWKMMTFSIEPTEIERLIKTEVGQGRNVILDLRGNGGGYVKSLEELAGFFFDKDMKIADRKGREEKKKENEPMTFKSRGANALNGKLIVLIDSQSGSASEIFARFVQLEKRGTVIGDVSAGAVMQSMSMGMKITSGMNNEIHYGASVTNADVIMSDGKSVEHVGVTPDKLMLPTAEDLLKQRDPVLSHAVELLGGKLTPEEAGKLFSKAEEWDDR